MYENEGLVWFDLSWLSVEKFVVFPLMNDVWVEAMLFGKVNKMLGLGFFTEIFDAVSRSSYCTTAARFPEAKI